ncbi:BolA family protein [Leptospira neocaledonica]|uniref:BolA family transcriptional regulator n=1 Tax=Leptospira neocaledonica TaxID=2023192 RepID=A0A2N0A3J9_9LEPT|nr:BolA family protein [Leptospira neocaledonica]PJZ78879.1 BolA family transcriptional regulator [Leptospira neocaledonica]
MQDLFIEMEKLLRNGLSPSELRIEDFSEQHAGHSGNPTRKKRGTHIRIFITSPEFQGKSLLEQHRSVYQIMDPFLKEWGVHALELKTSIP